MTVPLVVLASGAVIVGFLNATALHVDLFTQWVHFGPEAASEPFNYGFATVSFLGAAAGIMVGYRLYARWRERDPLRRLGPAYTVLEHKYYLDDIYMRGLVLPIRDKASAFVYWTNQHILDGVVNGTARVTRVMAGGVYGFDQQVIDGAVNGAGTATRGFGRFLRFLQSGNVQSYAVLLFVGTAFLTVAITRGLIAVIAAGVLFIIGLAWLVFRTRRSEERL
jgi:NADH-quinone oxidoreductase subunit L